MKSRFTCLDVHAACAELAPLVIGSRLQNIYDINSKTFLLKLNPKESEEKIRLVIESGTRIHNTAYEFESGTVQPSFFAMRMRKWLRDRRVTAFGQLGFDRVVHLEFGHVNPEQVLHLYLEFYSAGNIVLTDFEGTILLILRVVTNAQGEVLQKIGSTYTKPSSDGLSDIFEKLLLASEGVTEGAKLKKLIKEKFSSFSNPMTAHLVKMAEVNGCQEAIKQFKEDLSLLGSTEGILVLEESSDLYADFHAYPFAQVPEGRIKRFPSFNAAVDEFYGKIEIQKSQKAVLQQEKDANTKLDAIRKEQFNRISGLESVIELYLKRAQIIDAEPKKIQDAITVIRAAVDAGMDWKEFGLIIEEEKRKGNPTALLMEKLKLEKGVVVLRMVHEMSGESVDIDVDINSSPHANATRFYDLRRQACEKLSRTREAMEKALKSAEKKIRQDLRQSQTKAKRQQVFTKRKHLWFEKFHWFLSSDNYLVLAGRDMQQNELLVKRYLREGDVYVHADMHGAASVIVKGRKMEGSTSFMSIPPRTLAEAGTMSLCNSRAWEAKIVTSAWWVYATQVSKTAPSGEFLPTGSFMIRGKKNFLPPAPLLYGFGFMFVLDEAGRERQRLERIQRDKILAEGSETGSVEKYVEMLDINVDEPVEEINVTSNLPKKQQIKPESKKKKGKDVDVQEVKEKSGSRGAKGKQKKIAKKYADQDEEERQLRMALLSSTKKKAEADENIKKVAKEPKDLRKTPMVEKAVKQETLETPIAQPEPELAEEELAVGEDELGVIDALTGSLRGAFDQIQYAVPVAGPYSALTSHTFRLKLAPGSLKRGKAVQQGLSILLSDSRPLDIQAWSGNPIEEGVDASAETTGMFKRVKEMIRAVPDADLNQTMIGHVKIMASTKEIAKSKKDVSKKKQKSK